MARSDPDVCHELRLIISLIYLQWLPVTSLTASSSISTLVGVTPYLARMRMQYVHLH